LRKVLVGVAIVVGLLGQASPADASLKSLKKECRAGDEDACREYAYKRCLAEAKEDGADPDVCDPWKP
jgi:hypothetical protein